MKVRTRNAGDNTSISSQAPFDTNFTTPAATYIHANSNTLKVELDGNILEVRLQLYYYDVSL